MADGRVEDLATFSRACIKFLVAIDVEAKITDTNVFDSVVLGEDA